MGFVATGITISGGGWSGEVLDVTGPGRTRDAIPNWHQGSTPGSLRPYLPAKLIEGGSLSFDVAFSGAEPSFAAPGTITITWPDSGETRWSFHGFMTGFEPSGPLEQRATARVTIKVSAS